MSRIKIVIFSIVCIMGATLHAQESSKTDSVGIDTSEYSLVNQNFNLLVASYKGYEEEVLRLLKAGAYVDYRTDEGVTPLLYAAEFGYFGVGKILLLNGADPELKDYYGNAALHHTAEFNDFEFSEMLIREGANVDILDRNDRTPLMYAATYGYPLLADMFIYYRADVNKTDIYGSSALLMASLEGHTAIVKNLVNAGAVIEKEDDRGYTPLHAASQNGHLEIVKYLTELGANIELKTEAGHTPLSLAIIQNHTNVVEYLLDKGAKSNAPIAGGINPLNLAKENANDTIVSLLKNEDATFNAWPSFHYYAVNFDLNTSFDDFFLGFGLGMHDTKYRLSANLGYAIRIPAKAILISNTADPGYYQVWENRSFWYFNLQKRFALQTPSRNQSSGIIIGGQVAYSYARYQGFENRPDAMFLFSPQGGFYYRAGGAVFTLKYEYMNLDLLDVSPHRFNFTISFLLRDKYLKNSNPKESWLNNY